MNTSLIELRQNSATSVNNNTDRNGNPISADYSTTFDPPILLKDGDEVAIKSVFLDTRASNTANTNGRIKIDETNDKWDMNHMLYLNSYRSDGDYGTDFVYSDQNPRFAQAIDHPDGYTYVASYGLTAAESTNTLVLTKLTIKGGAPPRKRSKFSSAIIYTNAAGIEGQKYPIVFPPTDKHAKDIEVRRDDGTENGAPLNMVFKGAVGQTTFIESDIVFDDPVAIGDHGISLEPDAGGSGDVGPPYTNLTGEASALDNNDMLTPYIINTQFDIPHADYEPTALAKYITDRLTAQTWSGLNTNIDMKTTIPSFTPLTDPEESIYTDTQPTKNPFFTTIKQLQADRDYGYHPNLNEIIFVRRDGASILEINRTSTDNYIVGTPEVALIFDEGMNKFVWQQIHCPIMGTAQTPAPPAGTALNEGVQFRQVGATGDFFTATGNSGMMWASYGNTNGLKTKRLLEQGMGFDSSLFCTTSPNASSNYGHPVVKNNLITFSSQNALGLNQTGHLDGIDDFFRKDETFNLGFTLADAFIETINLESIIALNTRGPTGGGELSNGYFLIQIEGLPHQGVSYSNNAKNKNTSIKSIVGRFYATSDYTEDAGQGSIPYIYKGQPQFLSSLRVRVCDPDGDSTTSIGNDNCIFLQITSSQQTPQ